MFGKGLLKSELALGCLLFGSQLALAADTSLQFGRFSETVFNGTSTVCALMSDTLPDNVPISELNHYFSLESLSGHHHPSPSAAVLEGQFCISGLAPGHNYRLTLKKGLRSQSGLKLEQDVTREVKTSDARPEISTASGNVLAKTLNHNTLKIKSINVNKLRAYLYRINRADNATSNIYRYLEDKIETWNLYELLCNHAALVGEKTYELEHERNEYIYTNIDLNDFNSKREQGVYMVFVGDEKIPFNGRASDIGNLDNKHTWLAKIIYVTDLGTSVYAGKENGITVSVHSLTDASSVIGAKVRLIARNNAVLATTTTNSDGFASFSPKFTLANDAAGVCGVEVDSGSDYMFTDLRGSMLYIPQDYENVRSSYLEPPRGQDVFAYTDRGIYRPGETIHYVALVRDKQLKAATLPALQLTVKRPDGIVHSRHTLTNQGAGAFSTDFIPPSRGLQGSWTFELGEDKDTIYHILNISVQDFVPAHLTASLDTPEDTLLSSGAEPNRFKFSATFNYGAPAMGTTANGSVTISPDSHPLEQFKDYYFGPGAQQQGELNFNHNFDTVTLNEHGQGEFELTIPKADYARKLNLNVSLYDGSDEATSLNASYKIASQSPLIGIKQLKDEGLTVISVDAKGQPLPQELDYKLYRKHVDYQYVFKDDYWQYLRTERKILLNTGTLKAAGQTKDVMIPAPAEQGEYELSVTGTNCATTYDFYEGYHQNSYANSPDTFVLNHDKEHYKTGDMVKLEFDSLYEGNSVLAIGSQGVIKMSHYPVKKGHNEIQFKADESLAQGAHVLLTTYAPLDESPQVVRSVGLTYIPMDNTSKVLTVKLQSPEQLLPQQSLDVPVEIDSASNELYLTAALVDEGILSLTQFESPQPEVELFKPRIYRTEVYDMYGYLIRQLQSQDHGHGGMDALASLSAATLNDLSRRNVALFSGIVKLTDGKTTLHFDLPKHQGKLRLMVVAYDQDKIGSAQKQVTVRDRATIRADVPYVLHLGDQLSTSLRIHNLELNDHSFNVKVACSGSVNCSLEPNAATFEVKKGLLSNVPLQVTATDIGQGKLSLEVHNGDFSYQDELQLEVAPQISEQFSQEIYMLQPQQEIKVKPQDKYRPGALISVTKGSLPYVDTALFKEKLYNTDSFFTYNLIAAIDGTLHADYSSKDNQERQIKPNTAKLQDLIYALVSKVSDSGMVTTIEQTYAYDPFATVLAFKTLYEARQAGFDVPSAILSTMFNKVDALSRELSNPVVCAYALDALTLYGEVTLATLRYQFDELKPASALANIGYARAFKQNGDKERMNQALQQALKGVEDLISNHQKVLNLPKLEDQLKLISEIIAQENVFLSSVPYDLAELLDAALYCQNGEIFSRAASLLSGQSCFKSHLSKPTMASLLRCAVSLDMEEQRFESSQSELTLKNDSAKSVNYTVGILGYPKEIPSAPEGYSLEVAFYMQDGTPLRAPFELKRNEFFTAVYTLKRKTPLFNNLYLRGVLPTGCSLEKVIYSEDKTLNHYGNLAHLFNLRKADLGFVAELEDNTQKVLKFALLLRPAVNGTLILPAQQLSDANNPDLTVFTQPLTFTVK